MKALLCRENGPLDLLQLEEIDAPTPRPDEVLVDVHAAGVNFPDVLMVRGEYQVKPPLPFAPGGELAGTIAAIGANVSGWSVGDRVIGLVPFGAFAEQAVVPAGALAPLPEGMDFTTASAFTLTYGTAIHALRDRAALQAGETVLVLGAAGGVGIAAVQIAKAMGARVIAAASTAEKLAICAEAGADDGVEYTTEDLKKRVKQLTAGRGADVVVDSVGGPFSEPALRATAWRGRFLVIGFAAGDIPRIPLNLALLKGCALVGVFWGSFVFREPKAFAADLRQLADWHAAGTIQPLVSATYPLADGAAALGALADRQVKGKVVILTR